MKVPEIDRVDVFWIVEVVPKPSPVLTPGGKSQLRQAYWELC
jgi:hypothetical protein